MNVQILVVPYDSGQIRSRMGRGPEHLLESFIGPLLSRLGHRFLTEEITVSDPFLAEIKTSFALSDLVAQRVRDCRREGWFPLVLSGNCGIAAGTVSGCGSGNTGVVWFDAHGEATTPDTTTSGFLDGMGISLLTGQCWNNLATSISGFEVLPGERILLMGSRDLEPAEFELLDRVGVRRLAGSGNPETVIAPLAAQTDGVYVHLDLDVLDPMEAVANQWTPPDGMTAEAIKNVLRETQRQTVIKAVGIASYDPDADRDGRAGRAAASIIESLL
jgi:arginase